MTGWNLFSNIVGIALWATLVGATTTKSCFDGSNDVCNNLLTPPLDFGVLDVQRVKDKVHVKFDFYAPSIVASTVKPNELDLVLLSPLGLKFVKEVEAFKSETQAIVHDPKLKFMDPVANYYAQVEAKLTSEKAPKKYLAEILSKLPKLYSSVMGIYSAEAQSSYVSACKLEHKDQRKVAVVKKGVKNLAVGHYTWVGEFEYDTEYYKLKCKIDDHNWLLGLIQKDSEKTIDTNVTPLCINSDEISANMMFKYAGESKSKVLTCHGEEIHHHSLNKYDYVHPEPIKAKMFVDKKLNKTYWRIVYNFPPTLEMENVLKQGYYIRIYLPEHDYKKKLLDASAVSKMVTVGKPEGANIIVLYEQYRRSLSINFTKPASPYVDHEIKIDVSDYLSIFNIHDTLSLEFAVGNETVAESSYHAAKKWLEANKNLFKANERDKKFNDCSASVLQMYFDTKYPINITRLQKVAYSMPLKQYHIYNKDVIGILTKHAPSRYILSLRIDKSIVSPVKGGLLTVTLPRSEYVRYDRTYVENMPQVFVNMNKQDDYDETAGTLTVRLAKKNALDKEQKPFEGYVVPIPFKSDLAVETLINSNDWKIAVFEDERTFNGHLDVSLVPSLYMNQVSFKPSLWKYIENKSVLDCHFVFSKTDTKFVASVNTVVYAYTSFTVAFEKSVLEEANCNVTVMGDSVIQAQSVCDKDGKKATIYAHSAKSYIGTVDAISVVFDFKSHTECVRKYGVVSITVVGRNDETPVDESIGLVKSFEALKSEEETIVEGKVELDKLASSAKPADGCFSAASRIVTVGFNDNTRGVYFLTRVHDCQSPWLPPTGFDKSNEFSLKLLPDPDRKEAVVHRTVGDVYRVKSLSEGPSPLEIVAMRSKRFMEHTLYIFFTNDILDSLKTENMKIGPGSFDGELEIIERFMTHISDDWFSNIFGDIKYVYYDRWTHNVYIRRKVLFTESKEIKDEERVIRNVYKINSAIEHLLDDGFAHTTPTSMTESFSVLAFMGTESHSKMDRKNLKKFVEKMYSRHSTTQPIFMKVYLLDKQVNLDRSLKCKVDPFTIPMQPTETMIDERTSPSDISKYLISTMSGNHEIYSFVFESVATKVEDTKMPKSPSALKSGKIEREPQRKSFEVLIQFVRQHSPICPRNGRHIFLESLYSFMVQVYDTLARENIIVAACMKYDDKDDYTKMKQQYSLHYKGEEVLKINPGMSKSNIDTGHVYDSCNIYSLYKHMPKTLHYDANIEYTSDLTKAFNQPRVKLGDDMGPVPLTYKGTKQTAVKVDFKKPSTSIFDYYPFTESSINA
ncbi:hypothetical protein BaOVIS_019200 [Babesia ovis]|uniref:Uncharacterized protein n=1 Tax=Babesia ovis TaxID=5869 RepID=A0A9W5TBX1_BABOV|nr:hypothetical protein BaOVIS_019200 [Babesia ovis]